jgi:hypothetical protein
VKYRVKSLARHMLSSPRVWFMLESVLMEERAVSMSLQPMLERPLGSGSAGAERLVGDDRGI